MDIALSLMMLTTIALVVGAIYLFRRDGYRKQAVLMLALAVVMVINVAIWTLPTIEGNSLSSAAEKQQAPE